LPRIEWEDAFSVNNTEIDNQHKKWIDIYNTMHEGLTAKEGSSPKNIGAEVLEEMYEYASYHFHFEEEYMTAINYPEVSTHRRLHKNFDTQIYSYIRDIQEGRILLNSQILKTIKNWLLDHILIEDKKFASFHEKQNRSVSNK
jgi:hemerythrin-like metal-binding protein